MHSTKKGDPNSPQYARHKLYLRKVQATSLYCPRYEYNRLNNSMLSLSNNLILHQNYNPKEDLKPQRESSAIKAIRAAISQKKTENKEGSNIKQKVKWF